VLKKIVMIALSVGSFAAIAAPAPALATATITDVLGEAPGSIVAVSSNTSLFTQAGTFDCQPVQLAIELTQNDELAAIGNGEAIAEGEFPFICDYIVQNAFRVTSMSVLAFEIEKGTETGSLEVELNVNLGSSKCDFSGTLPFSFSKSSDTIHVAGAVSATTTGGICTPKTLIEGDFTVVDTVGWAVSLY